MGGSVQSSSDAVHASGPVGGRGAGFPGCLRAAWSDRVARVTPVPGERVELNRQVRVLLSRSRPTVRGVVTEHDLDRLPEPMRGYLEFTGSIGKPRVATVRLRQRGRIRQKEGGAWMRFEAEQHFTTEPPGFLWHARMKTGPLTAVTATDEYCDGKGSLAVRLPSLVRVSTARGPGIDQGSLLRYLAEMCWFPSAYLSDHIQWQPLNGSSARATMSYGGASASAVLHVNEAGRLTNLVAQRYQDSSRQMAEWSTPIDDYRASCKKR